MDDRMRKLRVLCVVASSNQLYSGMGRALFETARRLRPYVDYTFSIDDGNARSVRLLTEFAWRHGYRIHVSPAIYEADALDPCAAGLPDLLADRSWDAVECLGWADAATHQRVLEAKTLACLIYTPHHQPSWTVPMLPAVQRRVEHVHHEMLRRADLVLCDSPWERDELRRLAPEGGRFVYLPLGSVFEATEPVPFRERKSLLFVGDLAEPRKRFDRVLDLLDRLRRHRPSLRLTVIGNRTDELAGSLPERLRGAVDALGYVSEQTLRTTYAESLGLVLLSDYEAFGIPILESLAAGSPVFLSRQPTTHSIFADFKGVHFEPSADPDELAGSVERVLVRGQDELDEIAGDRPRLRAVFDWDGLAERKRQLMAAAWTLRRWHGRAG